MGSWILAIAILLILFIYEVYQFVMRKKARTVLTEEEFKNGYRKAQLIDVREPNEFDGGHILGARNIPVTQLKQRTSEIRKDQPIYLYCQSAQRSNRAAIMLYKRGYRDIYQLKRGYSKWTGKTKAK
ncbi:rhodanese-like domain-containing protein [Listeria aquatica]|uniref:Rhodanese-like domain-containing protein n=2 Tax=Listeria aquatica TaxID=1494960 RepID=W7AWC1_9LIST|nr:rhodanese-like domain-containing protein [Listeria aquatica]EUJ17550.1 rhodanese-like domain-containing protein [Listeria aquatica FSL S10-1188]MBC1521097.1 rhodanese-like domain-containing protein [Listeria aquatica]